MQQSEVQEQEIQGHLSKALDAGDLISFAYLIGQLDAIKGFPIRQQDPDWLSDSFKSYAMGYNDASGRELADE